MVGLTGPAPAHPPRLTAGFCFLFPLTFFCFIPLSLMLQMNLFLAFCALWLFLSPRAGEAARACSGILPVPLRDQPIRTQERTEPLEALGFRGQQPVKTCHLRSVLLLCASASIDANSVSIRDRIPDHDWVPSSRRRSEVPPPRSKPEGLKPTARLRTLA